MTMFAYPFARTSTPRHLSTAAQLMTKNPLTFDKQLSIPKAAALLRTHGLESAPIVDESGRLAGVVTTDACAAWEEFSKRSSPYGLAPGHADTAPVTEIASPAVETVVDVATADEVIDCLLEQHRQRAYVVNEVDEIVGMVSLSDVMRRLSEGRDPWRYRRMVALPMH